MNRPDQPPIHGPHCGEPTDVHVDIEGGADDFVEDCTVCCRPMLLHVERDETGTLTVSATAESE